MCVTSSVFYIFVIIIIKTQRTDTKGKARVLWIVQRITRKAPKHRKKKNFTTYPYRVNKATLKLRHSTSKKRLYDRMSTDKMSTDIMSTDKMSNRQNVDRHNVEQTKCRTDKMSNGQNVEQTKCRTDKMSTWKNADRQNVENYKIWYESDFGEYLNIYWYIFSW